MLDQTESEVMERSLNLNDLGSVNTFLGYLFVAKAALLVGEKKHPYVHV